MFAARIEFPGTEAKIFLSSDDHLDAKHHHKDLWEHEHEEARKARAGMFKIGDWSSCLLPTDMKRFVNSVAFMAGEDDILDRIVEYAVERYTPYLDNLLFLGCGNHETSVLKHHHVDITKRLVIELNRLKKNGKILYGGYTGFINVALDSCSYVIFYNHGQGGSAPVTKGMIDLSRRGNMLCDLVWLGHKHQKVNVQLDPNYYLDERSMFIKEKRKRGIISGGYEKNINQDQDILTSGYKLDYGEEKMRTPQEYGGFMLTLKSARTRNDTRFLKSKIEDMEQHHEDDYYEEEGETNGN